MRCRAGPLRVGQSLRDAYWYWVFGLGLPLLVCEDVCAEPKGGPGRSRYTDHEVTDRTGPGRQAILESVDTA